jgi:hypothetical protein
MLNVFINSRLHRNPNQHFRIGQHIFKPLFEVFGLLFAWRTR